MAGAYSSTPLEKKLGFKEGFVVRLYNEPGNYRSLFAQWPENIIIDSNPMVKKNLVHLFARQAEDLHRELARAKSEIYSNGSIWVSWPKKASKLPTDLTEDSIRQMALAIGLVDIKVCAVDDVWSGLKLVVPVKNR